MLPDGTQLSLTVPQIKGTLGYGYDSAWAEGQRRRTTRLRCFDWATSRIFIEAGSLEVSSQIT